MKKIIISIILAFSLIGLLLFSCDSADQVLAKRMRKMYVNDQNHVTFSGTVISMQENDARYIDIKCEELKNTLVIKENFAITIFIPKKF